LGLQTGRVIGRRYIDFVHSEDHQKTNEAKKRTNSLRNDQQFCESFMCGRTVRLVDVLWSASWSKTERITFGVPTITERKRAEEEIQKANLLLEERVQSAPRDCNR